MNVSDLVIRNNLTALKDLASTIDFDLKKILTIALKVLMIGSNYHFKNDAFAVGFTLGILSRVITKLEFRFNELNRSIDKTPLKFLQTAVIGHIILYPASLNLGALASGFYTGIGIAKLCK